MEAVFYVGLLTLYAAPFSGASVNGNVKLAINKYSNGLMK